jgi:pimeloyl-ACP methyl ester carboxylesterase
MAAIRRQFVRLGSRSVHLRIAGSGPALLLLHQSPQNSRMWLDLLARYAPHYTVIAPDTPGFGDSDPLALAQPGIDELAQATLELADALGLRRFAVLGMHTGGLIGMHLAWLAPSRVAALLIDGFAAFSASERAELGARYLPPFEASWDGAHLRWLWCRMREQLFYFPWFDGRAARALHFAPPTVQANHAAVMDVLAVGDLYRLGYGAALRYGDRDRVAQLQVPTWLLYRREDVLATHRERLPPLPDHVHAELLDGGLPALHARIDTLLHTTLAREVAANLQLAPPDDPEFRRRAVTTALGTLAAWHAPGTDDVRLFLHAPGTRPPRPPAGAVGDAAHQVWLDLPGHGASDALDAVPDVATMAAALVDVLAQLAPGCAVHVESDGAAAAYALALREHPAVHVAQVLLRTPWLPEADEIARFLDGLPDPTLQRTGAHLLEAFQWERERHLLWPWLAPDAAARRLVDAPDPRTVHDNAVELLRLGRHLRGMFASVLDPQLGARIMAAGAGIHIEVQAAEDYDSRASALAARINPLQRMPA